MFCLLSNASKIFKITIYSFCVSSSEMKQSGKWKVTNSDKFELNIILCKKFFTSLYLRNYNWYSNFENLHIKTKVLTHYIPNFVSLHRMVRTQYVFLQLQHGTCWCFYTFVLYKCRSLISNQHVRCCKIRYNVWTLRWNYTKFGI